jgi:iron complex outermembrane recepter protein
MVSRRKSLLMSAPLVILCTAGAQASAADEATPLPAPATQEPMLLEEIIVTAEKQASGRPLQIVPIAITAIDAATIQETHVQNIVDIGHMAPNVILDASGTLLGTAAFTIRGVGERSSTASIDPAVSVTQDGMALSLQTGLSLLGTFDTESVQILRGPQGVLQGVGAAGGAVTFTTPLPSDTFQAKASVTAGNFDTIGATSTIEGPLSDKVLGKIAVYEQRTAGYYNNTTDEGIYKAGDVGNPSGLEPQHPTGLVGGTQVVVVKPTFLVNLSDTLKLKVFAQFESDIDGGSATEVINPNPAPGAVPKFNSNYGYTATWQPYQTNLGTPGWTHITEEHLIGELDWNVGPGVWTTNAAIRHVGFDSVFNNAGSPFNAFLVYTKEENRQASIESRWSGALTEKLTFLAGVYLFADNLPVTVVDATNLGELGKKLAVADPNSPANMENQLIQYNQKTNSAAVFTNVDYNILSNLTLSAGVRYQYERKIFDIQPGANAAGVVYCNVGTLTNCPSTWYNPSKTWYTPTPRALLSWQATRDVLTYVSYTRGWAAGNFNGSPSTLGAAITPANPETVDSYELGLKSEWFEHRFRANVAVYDEKFDNIQRTATTAVEGVHVQTLLNAASATIRGAELELTALPFEGVKIFATGGFTHAVYNSFNLALPADTYNPNEPPTELSFANLPRWTADGGGSYSFDLPGVDGKFTFTADYSWRSMQFGDFGNTPQEIIKSYGLLNSSISHSAGPWTVSLWGRNLTNKYYDEAAAIAGGFQQWPGIPRTYGLTAYIRFR